MIRERKLDLLAKIKAKIFKKMRSTRADFKMEVAR